MLLRSTSKEFKKDVIVDTSQHVCDNSYMSMIYVAHWYLNMKIGDSYENYWGRGGAYNRNGYLLASLVTAGTSDSMEVFVIQQYSPTRARGMV